jgi:hypothetical protein
MVEVIKDKNTNLTPIDEGEDELIRVAMYLPSGLHRALKRASAIVDESASSIVRRALEKEIEVIELRSGIELLPKRSRVPFSKKEGLEVVGERVKIDDSALKRVLDRCSTFFGGFEIDGEGGFVSVFGSQDWKLKDLTSTQWAIVLDKLIAGWKGYDDKPSEEDWLAKFEELEPSEEQLENLRYEE